MSTRDKVAEVLITHQRIPMYDGTGNSRCVGCDHLQGETDGPNSPRHAHHLADALAEAGLLRVEKAEQALAPETLAEWRRDAKVIEREGAISGVRVLAKRTTALMDALARVEAVCDDAERDSDTYRGYCIVTTGKVRAALRGDR